MDLSYCSLAGAASGQTATSIITGNTATRPKCSMAVHTVFSIIILYLPVILRASLFNLLSVSLKLYFCFLSTVFALDLNAPTPRLRCK